VLTGPGDKPTTPRRKAKVKLSKPLKPRVVKPPAGDIASSGGDYGMKQAERAKRSNPTVRKNTRAVYVAQPTAQKRAILRNATGAVAQNVRHEHASRVARNDDLAASQAQHDISTSGDISRAAAYLQAHPEILHPDHPHHSLTAGIGNALGSAATAAIHAASDFAAKEAAKAGSNMFQSLPKNNDYATKGAANAGRELVDIPANVIPSTYDIAATATHDPYKAAGMIVQPYIDAAKHPLKSLEEHPVGTILLASGVKGAVGRGGGKALRSAPSETLRKVGSTDRPHATRTVPGTSLTQTVPYSRDVINKGIQVVGEKVRKAKVKPMSNSEIQRRVDETVSATEDIRRVHRARATNAAHEAITNTDPAAVQAVRDAGRLVLPKRAVKVKATAATSLIAQNAVKPTRESLVAYRADLEAAAGQLSGDKLRRNKQARAQIDDALKHFDAGKTEVAARKYAELTRAQTDALVERGLLTRAEADTASLVPYAQREMGATFAPTRGFVDRHGNDLTAEQIRADMAANHVSEPGYVTHAPSRRGAQNFYISSHEPKGIDRTPRTGQALSQGTLDLHPDTMLEGAARSQGLVDSADGYKRFVHEFGVKGGSGKPISTTYKRAQEIARELMVNPDGTPKPNAVEMRPVRIDPFGARAEQMAHMRANDDIQGMTNSVRDSIDEALAGKPGDGSWTLVPKVAADRMREHTQISGAVGKVGQVIGRQFRGTVLPLSTKWLAGNVIEAATRAMIGHVGPRSVYTGVKVKARLRQIDPDAADQLSARVTGGGHLSVDRRVGQHTGAERFAGTKLAGVATALGKFWRAPGPKQMAGVWHSYTDFVFNTLNGRFESAVQTAMLGKELREHPLMSGHVVKVSQRAIDDAAQGLTNTRAQVELGRKVRDMYGQYDSFSPAKRRAIATYTPFLAWTLNALKFLYVTLPKDHPVLTSVIAASNNSTYEWRKAHGMVTSFGGMVDGAAPGFLQGSVPGKDGSNLRLSRFTPFGLLSTNGGPLESVADTLLPQYMDLWQNARGQDWKGSSLAGSHQSSTQAQNALAAAVTFIENSVPGTSQVATVTGAHLPNEAAGARKEPTAGARARKLFDPFMYTQASGGAKGKVVVVRPKVSSDPTGLPPLPLP
jgi:hypothetical protein